MSRPPAPVALLAALAALLIFTNLDARYLWDDEAETALLAQRVLRFGVPIAWDGRDLISQECSTDYDANYLWRQTPWLPIYATALSFALFGADTAWARLPFALLGVLAVPSLYALARAVLVDRGPALLSTGLLVLSVPFLLHVRQDRYYALAIVAAIWVLYFFFAALRRDRLLPVLGLALALTLLFHSNYLVFFATVTGLLLASCAARPDAGAALRLAGAGAATLLINVPWIGVFDLLGKGGTVLAASSAKLFVATLVWYARRIDLYAFPVLALAALVAAGVLIRGVRWLGRWPAPAACLTLAAFCAGHLLFLAAMPFAFFRYLVTLLPAFALLTAAAVVALWSGGRALAVLALLVTLLVDRADLWRGTLDSTLWKYVHEVTTGEPGVTGALVSYLRLAGRPGERLFISYGDLPLRFYTELEIRGGQGCQSLAGWPRPDWIVLRHFFRFHMSAPAAAEDEARTARFLRAELSSGRYRAIELSAVDTVWENIPEPESHVYRALREGPRVTIYRKVLP